MRGSNLGARGPGAARRPGKEVGRFTITPLSRPARRAFLALALCAGLAGCADLTGGGMRAPSERADLTPAQECAIGYDMARRIYKVARVSETVIRVSPDLGPCGRHAGKYLRQAGFAVDETATRRDAYVFGISTWEDAERQVVIATANLPGLQLTRAYRRAGFGVTPASGFNIIHGNREES